MIKLSRRVTAHFPRLATLFLAVVGCLGGVSTSLAVVVASYDSLNRLTSVVYSPTQRIDYVYDAAGNLIEERINGAAGLSVTAQPSPLAGGTVAISPAQSSFLAGDVVTVTATPASGYNFAGWSGVSGCAVASSCTFTVGSSSITAVANFAAVSNLQPLRVIAVPPEGGTVTPPNPAGYAPGTSVSLTATPAAALGYTQIDWYGAGCTNFVGVTCNFSMPNAPSDVFVRFRKVGSGQELVVSPATMAGLSYNAQASGIVDVSPAQQYIQPGTTVTLKFRPAAGYRIYSLSVFRSNGSWVADTTLCASVQSGFWFPGDEPSCSFAMPSNDVMITPTFVPDPVRYLVDATVSPISGGSVSFDFASTVPSPVLTNWYPTSGSTDNRRTAAAGTSVTLTAKPANARQFLNWQNGPCANSPNPVCSFVMPANDVASNPLFSEPPPASCTYAVTAPSLAFPGVGATRTISVATQAGCNFNVSVHHQNGASDSTYGVVDGIVTFTLPAHTANYGRVGHIQIDTGREMYTLPFMQAGNSTNSQSIAPNTDFGTSGTGEVPTSTRTVTFSNTTGGALVLSGIVTVGPYAIRSHTCSGTLAVSASCNAVLEFVPKRVAATAGELLLVANNHIFSAPLSGTAVPTRENVAAMTAGGSVAATTVQDVIGFPSWALNDGGRRNPPVWMSGEPVNPQYLEVRFAGARTVDRLYLFGNYTTDGSYTIGYAEPSTVATEIAPQLTGFSVQYWTGTAWANVAEISRVDGPNVWRRVMFAPISTDRMRIVLPAVTSSRQMVANEIEAWTVLADTAPDPFTFSAVLDVPPSTLVQSVAVTPVGYSSGTTITVSGGSYSIGCNGVFTSAAGTLQPGQSVCVRHTSSSTGATTVTTTLTIGGVPGTFSSTTQTVILPPTDVTPDPIPSQTILDIAVGSMVYFAPFTVTGINAPAALTVSGAGGLEVSVGCNGAYSSTPGPVTNGVSVCVRHVAASVASTSVVSSLAVGTATVTFTSRTVVASTCSLVSGPQSVPANANAQLYTATCSVSTVGYVWQRDGATVTSCTSSTCNIAFAANNNSVSVVHTVSVAPADNNVLAAAATLLVTQSAGAPACTGVISGTTSVPSAGGTFSYSVSCQGATEYAWALDNINLPSCLSDTCNIALPSNSTSSPISHAITAWAVGTTSMTALPALTVTVAPPQTTCSLDFDGDSRVNASDALLFSRWLLGFRGAALVSGVTPYPSGTSTSAFATAVTNRMALGTVHDFDNDGRVTAGTDGLVFMRLAQGLTGTAVTNGAVGVGATRTTHEAIRTHVNGNCGTTFLAQPSTVLFDLFDGTALDPLKWTEVRGGAGIATVSGNTVTFGANASANTQGKVEITASRVVIEGRFTGLGATRDTTVSLVDASTGDLITFGDTSYQGYGLYSYGTGQYLFAQQNQGGTTSSYKEYRLTIDGTSLTLQRGDALDAFTESRTVTLPTTIAGKTFFLRISTGGPSYSPGTFDWVRVLVQ